MMIDIIFDVALDDLLGLFPRIVILKYFSMFFLQNKRNVNFSTV